MTVNPKFYKSQDYQYLRHEACEVCGSRNNVGVWKHLPTGKETKHCFTEGCTNNVHTKDLFSTSQPGFPLPDDWLEVLRVSPQTAAKYKMTYEGKILYFGYTNSEGRLQRVKKRDYNIPKDQDYHFTWLTKEGETTLLYGMSTCTNPDKNLIITEGELDAPCAYEMTGWNAVSIPNGCQGADNAIRDNYLWLKQFKKIYICFDNDAQGQAAALRVKDIIGFRARIVSLPQYTIPLEDERVVLKDARDYRKYSFDTEFLEAIVAADRGIRPYVWSREEVRSKLAESYQSGHTRKYSTGIKDLDALCPIRLKELTICFGAPGRGKSSLGRFLAKTLIKQGVRPYYMSFEESIEDVIYKLSALLLSKPVYYDTEGNITNPIDEVLDNGDMVLDQIDVAKLESIEPDDIYDAIECAYVSYGCQFILLDHITWLLDSAGNPVQTARAILHKLCELVAKYPIHIFAISHNQPGQKPQPKNGAHLKSDWEEYEEPTQRDAQWSSGFAQLAYSIWGLKNPDSPTEPMRIHVLKNRRGGIKNCGKVYAYYQDDGTFLGVKDYAAKMSGNKNKNSFGGYRDTMRLETGSATVDEVPPTAEETGQMLCSVPTQTGDDREDNRTGSTERGYSKETSVREPDPGNSGTTEETLQSDVSPGLHSSSDGVNHRVQGSDDGWVRSEGGSTEKTTSNVLQKVSFGFSKSRTKGSKKKNQLPRLGRQDGNSLVSHSEVREEHAPGTSPGVADPGSDPESEPDE